MARKRRVWIDGVPASWCRPSSLSGPWFFRLWLCGLLFCVGCGPKAVRPYESFAAAEPELAEDLVVLFDGEPLPTGELRWKAGSLKRVRARFKKGVVVVTSPTGTRRVPMDEHFGKTMVPLGVTMFGTRDGQWTNGLFSNVTLFPKKQGPEWESATEAELHLPEVPGRYELALAFSKPGKEVLQADGLTVLQAYEAFGILRREVEIVP